MNFSPRKQHGFTLMELLISVAILAILMLATTEIFAKSFRSYRETKKVENAITESQFLLNLLAKELRTSTVVSSGGQRSQIKFYDHSKSECVQYRFNSGNQSIEIARSSLGVSFSSCNNSSDLSGFAPATVTGVSGSFNYEPTHDSIIGDNLVVPGLVTMNIRIDSSGTFFTLQSTVSLRDYGETTNPR